MTTDRQFDDEADAVFVDKAREAMRPVVEDARTDVVQVNLADIEDALNHQPCCEHVAEEYGNCFDCRNTGCAHPPYIEDGPARRDMAAPVVEVRRLAGLLAASRAVPSDQGESIVCMTYPDCDREHAGGAGGIPVHPPVGAIIGGDEPAVPSDRTATTEDADLHDRLQAVIAPVVAPYTSGPMDPLDLQVVDAVMGLLATAPSTATTEDAGEVRERTARTLFLVERGDALPSGFSERQWDEGHVGPIVSEKFYREADALIAAGLLATARPDTTTEWGVRAWGEERPCSDESGARLMSEKHGIPLVRREVTAWIEAGQ